MNVYAVDEWVVTDGGGRWYECRQVEAINRREAILKAFPSDGGNVPNGYRLRLL